ncbi:hypothetical protein H0E87_030291 [Populus deltoides]|uniref:Uncharacterized protein n=1 Tax=Populus deltoides TaxID=3696 RepID=A0A8T2WFX4_POPDE|nr:hypothetical protein H0E87_030291 [Populus deltoides]
MHVCPKAAHAYTFKHAGSGHKRKKSTPEINKDYRERKKEEVEKLKAETEELKKSKFHLDGQAFQLRMDLKETREENINLKIVEKSQSDSILEIGKKLIALGEHHQKEIQALKEEHAQEMLERNRDWHENAGEMNNPMETPATAQATTFFFNSDHFASQMASLGKTYVAGVNILNY